MTRYETDDAWAWVEALDGRRRERVAWAANVRTGQSLTFENTAWLIWVLLADGPADAGILRQRAAAAGAEGALDELDVEGFLAELHELGVLRLHESGA